jgi:hypothetical protein
MITIMIVIMVNMMVNNLNMKAFLTLITHMPIPQLSGRSQNNIFSAVQACCV